MALQAQLELQGREALWVFLAREENAECLAFQDQRSVGSKSSDSAAQGIHFTAIAFSTVCADACVTNVW